MRAQCALALAGQVQVKRITRGCKYGEIVDNLDDDDCSPGGSCTNVFGVMFQSVEDLTDRDNMMIRMLIGHMTQSQHNHPCRYTHPPNSTVTFLQFCHTGADLQYHPSGSYFLHFIWILSIS